MSDRLLTSAARLSAEESPLEHPRLPGREARLLEHFHHLVCELPLVGRKRGWMGIPEQTRANVRVEPRRMHELVGELVQLAHLLEQRLEPPIVDRHDRVEGTPLAESYSLAPLAVAEKCSAERFKKAAA
jgi:hypothetical protein